jgi:hypothetical protein
MSMPLRTGKQFLSCDITYFRLLIRGQKLLNAGAGAAQDIP